MGCEICILDLEEDTIFSQKDGLNFKIISLVGERDSLLSCITFSSDMRCKYKRQDLLQIISSKYPQRVIVYLVC